MSLSRTADVATPIEADSKQRKQIPAARSFGYPLVLTVIATLLFLPGLGARDFWAPGEPIYGEVIRVMFEKNNWLVPMLNGHIYADKPVLYFWLALVVSKLGGGVSEWTVRLPTALGAFGLVLTTYQLGRTFYDRETGFLAGLILATTHRVLWESRFLRLDTVLSFFLLLGFFWFLKAFLGKGPKYFFIGSDTHEGADWIGLAWTCDPDSHRQFRPLERIETYAACFRRHPRHRADCSVVIGAPSARRRSVDS